MDVAPVEADDEGQVRPGQFFPLGGAAVDKGPLLGAELAFETFGDGLGVLADGAGVEGTAEGEDLGQELGGQAIGGQPGELGFQVAQLGRGPLGQGLGQRGERTGLGRLAGAVVPAGLARRSVPKRVRTTMVRLSLWRRAFPQPGQPPGR